MGKLEAGDDTASRNPADRVQLHRDARCRSSTAPFRLRFVNHVTAPILVYGDASAT